MGSMTETAILIACAHGTDNAAGRREIDRLREEIAGLRPGIDVREAYVDVQQPELPDVIASLPEGVPAIIVPLLLSVGYHVKVDIARAAQGRSNTFAALPLGPDPRLAGLLAGRLLEAGVRDPEAVVLAAAGSSDACASVDVGHLVRDLQALRAGPVRPGFGSKARPSVPEATRALRAASHAGRVAVASYLLAPGYFHDQLSLSGADVVSAPLLPHPVVAEVALERYDAVALRLQQPVPPTPRNCDRPCRAAVETCVRAY